MTMPLARVLAVELEGRGMHAMLEQHAEQQRWMDELEAQAARPSPGPGSSPGPGM
ncbi:MAG: hypothetical protein KIC89_21735 [Acetobacteraceae bacterium]|nr:hypothetical protein [Acetobacteraceae bacterium]